MCTNTLVLGSSRQGFLPRLQHFRFDSQHRQRFDRLCDARTTATVGVEATNLENAEVGPYGNVWIGLQVCMMFCIHNVLPGYSPLPFCDGPFSILNPPAYDFLISNLHCPLTLSFRVSACIVSVVRLAFIHALRPSADMTCK